MNKDKLRSGVSNDNIVTPSTQRFRIKQERKKRKERQKEGLTHALPLHFGSYFQNALQKSDTKGEI